MEKKDLPSLAKCYLGKYLNQSGAILYSSHETLKKGDVYLLGYNPAGEKSEDTERFLSAGIDRMLTYAGNEYLDEKWSRAGSESKKGEAPLQKRIDWVLKQLNFETKEVCASNLIFVSGKKQKNIDYKLAELCWPVHEAILNIVQPKLILVFGNGAPSPYRFLHDKWGGQEDDIPAKHALWKVKGFEPPFEIFGRKVYVVGFPHLSRYSPDGKPEIIKWIKKKIASLNV